jgi:two-component system LytT family response regulator
MKILVADDEALARKRVLKLIEPLSEGNSVFEASSGKETLVQIKERQPDLVFLDIQMTDMTGFDVIEQIGKDTMPIIIFVTAYDNFAVRAFEVRAIDFLLKPFKKERFEEAYKRALEHIQNDSQKDYKNKITGFIDYLHNNTHILDNHTKTYLDKIVLKIGKKYYFIDTTDIKYIVSSAYYAEIFTSDGEKHIYRISMTDFILKLSPSIFIRINRSTIINMNYMKEIISEGLGDFSIKMKDSQVFSLSKIYKTEFLQKMDIKS